MGRLLSELVLQVLVGFFFSINFRVGLVKRIRFLLKLLLVQSQFVHVLLKNLLHLILIERAVVDLLFKLFQLAAHVAPILAEKCELLLHKVGYLKHLSHAFFKVKPLRRGALRVRLQKAELEHCDFAAQLAHLMLVGQVHLRSQFIGDELRVN